MYEECNGHRAAAASALPGYYQDTRPRVDVWTWTQGEKS